MAQTFQLPVTPKGEVAAVFPQQCVNCGQTAVTKSKLMFARQVQVKKRTKQLTINLSLPHCQSCAQASKNQFLAGLIPFGLGFVGVGATVFVLVTLYASYLGLDEGTQSGTYGSWVLGGAAALIVGFAAGFVVELFARILLIPVWGRALWHAPLLAWQFLTDSDYVAGVRVRPVADYSAVQLTFFNQETAQTFARLNPSAVKSGNE